MGHFVLWSHMIPADQPLLRFQFSSNVFHPCAPAFPNCATKPHSWPEVHSTRFHSPCVFIHLRTIFSVNPLHSHRSQKHRGRGLCGSTSGVSSPKKAAFVNSCSSSICKKSLCVSTSASYTYEKDRGTR